MKDDTETRKQEILSRTLLFSELSPEDKYGIARYSDFRTCRSGETLFEQGEAGRSLYIVKSGQVIVRKTDEDGLSRDIARYVRGTFFGELDLFTAADRAASAVTDVDTLLLEFPGSGRDFEEFLYEYPSVAARVLHRILIETAGRIRRVNQLAKENSPLVQELQKQVYRDKLTGLYNQVYLQEKLKEMAGKGASPFAVCILKPDNFKLLNDTFGHEAGDIAIRLMAAGLRDFVGDEARTVRYRGNAMAVIFPGTGRAKALREAERLRGFFNKLELSEATGGREFRFTTSIGVGLSPGFPGTVEELLTTVHELPLEGRSRGGNSILFVGETEGGEG